VKDRGNSADGDTAKLLETRRASVQKIIGIGGVTAGTASLGQWVKPVVQSVVLPAHAETTDYEEEVGEDDDTPPPPDPSIVPTDPCGITVTCNAYRSIIVEINGFITPAIPDVTVGLLIQYLIGGNPIDDLQDPPVDGPPQTLILVTTDINGDYTYTAAATAGAVEISAVEVTATLPDYPGEPTICSVSIGGDGDETGIQSSVNYFCQNTN
jgi:hypothetical protein